MTYSRVPDGTRVPSFTGSLSEDQRSALAQADHVWAGRDVPAPGGGRAALRKTVVLPPGRSETVAVFDRPGAITGMICSVPETEAGSMERVLREVTISLAWDGETRPSVWSPLGDFFGSGPGFNPFRALPCGMTRAGMYASWYMPFRQAVVRLTNDGPSPRRVMLTILHEPLDRPADQLLRFHAKWHRDQWGPGGVGRYARDRWPDWPLLLADGGPGRFCGVALHIWNPLNSWDKKLAAQYVKHVSELCPDPGWFQANVMPDYWWGEGDEKFFVDGEKYPSTFGTGTEDYFGFAWGTPAVFDSATQCQTRNAGNTGHISVARWHIADDIPFQKSFEACIEKYHGDNWPLLYAATVYWYQAPHLGDLYPALPVAQRENYYTLPQPASRFIRPGAIECETMNVLNKTSGMDVEPQDMAPWGREHWSGGKQLVVKATQAGDFVELEIPVAGTQPQDIWIYPTMAPDFGTLSFRVNGRPSSAVFDAYAETVRAVGPIRLGTFRPQDGHFVLRVEVTGSDLRSSGARYFFGLDCVTLKPEETAVSP